MFGEDGEEGVARDPLTPRPSCLLTLITPQGKSFGGVGGGTWRLCGTCEIIVLAGTVLSVIPAHETWHVCQAGIKQPALPGCRWLALSVKPLLLNDGMLFN